MSTIRFHLRGSRALINGSLAIQNDGSGPTITGVGPVSRAGLVAVSKSLYETSPAARRWLAMTDRNRSSIACCRK
jgi:hypothetical protein